MGTEVSSNKYIPIKSGGVWGLYNIENGSFSIAPAHQALDYASGIYCSFKSGGKYGYIKIDGIITVAATHDYAFPAINGVGLIINSEGKYHYIKPADGSAFLSAGNDRYFEYATPFIFNSLTKAIVRIGDRFYYLDRTDESLRQMGSNTFLSPDVIITQ